MDEIKVMSLVGCNVQQSELIDLVTNLQVYDINGESGPLNLTRFGRDGDGGYVVVEKSFDNADILMSYGIAGDSSFEEAFVNKYKKDAYGFDCSIESVSTNNDLFHFVPECISSGDFISKGTKSSMKITTFLQQVNTLKLEDKNIFIKMDIEGAEYNAWSDILSLKDQITGVAMELHLRSREDLPRAIKLTDELKQHFYLVNVHGNNCPKPRRATFDEIPGSSDRLPVLLELTYINKDLVTSAVISEDQSHPSKYDMPNCNHYSELKFNLALKQECLAV